MDSTTQSLMLMLVEIATALSGLAFFGVLEGEARRRKSGFIRLIGLGILASSCAFIALLIGQALVVFGNESVGYPVVAYAVTVFFDLSGLLATLGIFTLLPRGPWRTAVSVAAIGVFLWSMVAFSFTTQLFRNLNGIPVGDLQAMEIVGDMAGLVMLFVVLVATSVQYWYRKLAVRDRPIKPYQAFIGNAGFAGVTLLVLYLISDALWGDAASALSFLAVPVMHAFLFLGAVSKDNAVKDIELHPWKVFVSSVFMKLGGSQIVAVVIAGLMIIGVAMGASGQRVVISNRAIMYVFADELMHAGTSASVLRLMDDPNFANVSIISASNVGYGVIQDGKVTLLHDDRAYDPALVGKIVAAAGLPGPSPEISSGGDQYIIADDAGTIGFVRASNLDLARSVLRAQFGAAFFAVALLLLLSMLQIFGIAVVIAPIGALSRATVALAKGEYATRIEEGRIDEFGALAASFNVMAATIKDRSERLAEALAQQRSFMLNTAHDFKTPLTHFRWSLELLEQDDSAKLSTEQKEIVAQMRQTTARLVLLAEDILEMTRIDEHRIVPQLVPLDLRTTIDEVASGFSSSLRDRGITFVWDHANAATVLAMADAGIVVRILRNLLSNAEKYTKTGGMVRVTLEGVGDVVRLAVSDTGIGIPKAEQAKIFGRFFRASNVQGLEVEGTGIGLTMCMELAKVIGGTLAFESEEGKGSTFRLDLPMAAKA